MQVSHQANCWRTTFESPLTPSLLSSQAFALEYYKQNKEGPVKSEDAAYILSFAIMMLHTSLHNPSVRHKTTKEQWLAITRGQV